MRKGILLGSSNPSTEDYLDQLEKEVEGIHKILSASGLESKIEIFEETRFKLSRLFGRFNSRYKGKVHLLHYCGHSDEEKIYLEKPGSGVHAMDINDFASFLKLQPDIEVVFLNSCSSYVLGEQLLKGSNIKAVIETTQPVEDKEAEAFAISIYTTLAKGKNLKQSFEEAYIMHKAEFSGEYTIQNKSRTIHWGEANGSHWQLSFKDGGDTWRLIPGTVKDRLDSLPEDTVKVLCLVSEKDEGYYDALKASFIDNDHVFIYHIREILSEVKGQENQISCLNAADAHCLMLGPSLLEFWKDHLDDDRFKLLADKPTALIACKGDTEQQINFLKKYDVFSEKKSIRAPHGFTLEEIAQIKGSNLDPIFNSYCHKDLENLLFTNEKDLAGLLINLNFNHQKKQYDKQFVHQKSVFLILLEGTSNCAQEVLIKALSRLPDTNLDLEELEVSHLSIGASFPNGILTKDSLFEEVKRTLLPPPYPADLEGLMESIRKRLDHEQVVFILNDIDLITFPQLPQLLHSFWKEMVGIADNWETPPPNRLFFFLLNKSADKDFPKGTFKQAAKDSYCHTFLLDRIACLEEYDFNQWHGNASSLIPPYSNFHTLPNQRKEILEKQHLSQVISEICRILKRPAISEKVLSI